MSEWSPMPGVVALVPAYNAANFIAETLRSLAGQTYGNLRVIVSVDRSEDDTAAHCTAFARHDPRFTVIVQPERLGWVGNTNALLRLAADKYAFFMGHDDVVEPDYVARLAAALLKNPRAVLSFSDMDVVAPDHPSPNVCRYTALDGVADPVGRGRRLIVRDHAWWNAYRGLFRLDAARRVGGLRRHLAGEFVADWPFVLGLALQGECVRVPEVLYRKRSLPGSLSHTWVNNGWAWIGTYLSCGRTVAHAELPFMQRLALLVALVSRGCRAFGRRLWCRVVREMARSVAPA